MFGTPPRPPITCGLGHPACQLHASIKPDLSLLPGVDREPRSGVCIAGPHAAARVWVLPRDGHNYCKRHLRVVLRIATFPDTLRFPGDA